MSGSSDKPMSEQCEFDFFTVFGESEQTSKPMSEPCEFDFDAPVGDDYVSASPAPEAAPDVEGAPVTDAEVAGAEEIRNETAREADAPLYGAEGYDAEGWKSVNFHVDDGDADCMSQDSDGSGDDSMPPPDASSASSNGNEPDSDAFSDGSRIDGGYLPATQTELNSDGSDRSDRSGTFSSIFDDDNTNWISPIYPESVWRTLEGAGKPYEKGGSKDGSVKATAIRARFFARYAILRANLHNHQGKWYAYSEETGTWKDLNEAKLLNIIDECVTSFGDHAQVSDFGKLCTVNFCQGVMKMMVPIPGYEDIFDHAPTYAVTVRNGTLTFDSQGHVTLHEHSPNFLSRVAFGIEYDPTVDTSEFVEFAFPTVENKEEIPALQMYAGQCLLGKNIAQKILQLHGDADAGKTQFMKLFQHILGPGLWTNLIPEKVKRPFEIASYEGVHVLFAPDETGDAMLTSGGRFMKGGVGEDPMTGESKFSNERTHFNGAFNIITTSNAVLKVPVEDDRDAWWRRLLIVRYKGKPRRKIKHFASYILKHYGKEVMKWMTDGIVLLRLNGGDIPVPPTMAQHIDEVLQESDPYLDFVKTRVKHTGNKADRLPSMSLLYAFKRDYEGSDKQKTMLSKLAKAMLDAYGAKKSKHLPGPDGSVVNLYVGFKLIQENY